VDFATNAHRQFTLLVELNVITGKMFQTQQQVGSVKTATQW
jgi:hypothetical protein